MDLKTLPWVSFIGSSFSWMFGRRPSDSGIAFLISQSYFSVMKHRLPLRSPVSITAPHFYVGFLFPLFLENLFLFNVVLIFSSFFSVWVRLFPTREVWLVIFKFIRAWLLCPLQPLCYRPFAPSASSNVPTVRSNEDLFVNLACRGTWKSLPLSKLEICRHWFYL